MIIYLSRGAAPCGGQDRDEVLRRVDHQAHRGAIYRSGLHGISRLLPTAQG